MRWISGVLALVMLGAFTVLAAPPEDKPKADKPAPRPTMLLAGETGEEWPMSLSEAVRIALDNIEIVFVYAPLPPETITELDWHDTSLDHQPDYTCTCSGTFVRAPIISPFMIHRVNANTPLWRFRPEAMSLVRSVEKQYWVVAAQRARVACAEQVIKAAREVVQKEQGELTCRGSVCDIVEAIQRLEYFQKVWETRTVRLAEADRELRILLGLPHSDGRHIVTVTRPIDGPIASAPRDAGSPNDDDYRRYQQAKRHRIEAARRLEARKAWYEEGRITADRYIDAIGQHAEAVATEAYRASMYNLSIAALGEAKGTLLADRFILVIDQPLRMPKNWVDGPDRLEEPVKKAPVEVP
jgi:hypothetical protein